MLLRSRRIVYVIGCSSMGAYIAGAMSKLNFDVYVIDVKEDAFRNYHQIILASNKLVMLVIPIF